MTITRLHIQERIWNVGHSKELDLYSNDFSRGWRQMEKAYTYEQAVTTITDSLAFHPYPGTDVRCTFMDLKYMYGRSLQKRKP